MGLGGVRCGLERAGNVQTRVGSRERCDKAGRVGSFTDWMRLTSKDRMFEAVVDLFRLIAIAR